MTIPEMTSKPGTSANLAGRVCVVLGAHGTLGTAIGRSFESAGATVVGADLKESPTVLPCDVTDETAVSAVFDRAQDRGRLTDVVHAVGLASVGSVESLDIPTVRTLLEVNLLSCFVTAKIAASRLPRGGTVTFIASHAALHGSARWSAYGASKAGVVNLTQAFADEVGNRGIRVNSVSPGSIDSSMMDSVLALTARERGVSVSTVRREAEKASPLGRFASAEEIAGVCVFLASPQAAYITGANIIVNGGERPG